MQKKSWNVAVKKSLSRTRFAVLDSVAFAVRLSSKNSQKPRPIALSAKVTAARGIAVPLLSVAVGIAVLLKYAFRGMVRTSCLTTLDETLTISLRTTKVPHIPLPRVKLNKQNQNNPLVFGAVGDRKEPLALSCFLSVDCSFTLFGYPWV